jgi:hypothetical protein
MTNGLTNSSSGSWPDMKGIWLVSSKELSLGYTGGIQTQTGSIIFQEGSLDYSTSYGQEGYEVVFGSFNSAYGYTDLNAPLKLNIYTGTSEYMETFERYNTVIFSLTDKSGTSLAYQSVRADSIVGDVVVSISTLPMSNLTLSIDNGETNILSYSPSGDVPIVSAFKIRYRTNYSNWFNRAKLVKSRCKNVMMEDTYYHCYDIANDEYNEYE